jgi:hypothetical protein
MHDLRSGATTKANAASHCDAVVLEAGITRLVSASFIAGQAPQCILGAHQAGHRGS